MEARLESQTEINESDTEVLKTKDKIDEKIIEEIDTRVKKIRTCIEFIQQQSQALINQIKLKEKSSILALEAELTKLEKCLTEHSPDPQLLQSLKKTSLISIAKPMTTDLTFLDPFFNQTFFEEECKGLDIDISYKDISQIKSLLLNEVGLILESHTSEVNSITVHDSTLISAGKDKQIRFWDIKTRLQQFSILNPCPVTCISQVYHSSFISGGEDFKVRHWDLPSKSLIFTFSFHSGPITSVALNKNGNYGYSSSTDCGLCIWDLKLQELRQVLKISTFPVWVLALSPDHLNLYAAVGGKEGRKKDYSVYIIKTLSESPADQLNGGQLAGHDDQVTCIAASLNAKVYTGGKDSFIAVWDSVKCQLLSKIKGHTNWLTALTLSSDELLLFSAGADNTIRVWFTSDYRAKVVLTGHSHVIKALSFVDTSGELVSASADRSVRIWQASGTAHDVLQGHSDLVNSICFSYDKKWAASASKDKSVRVWDLRTRTQVAVLEGHNGEVQAVAFCKDNQTICSVGDTTLRIWDRAAKQPAAVLKGHRSNIYCLALAKDDSLAATAGGDLFSKDYSVCVWDIRNFVQVQVFLKHTDTVYALAFTDNGKYLVSAGFDKSVLVWDMERMELKTCLEVHKSTVYKVLTTNDSEVVMSSSRDGEYFVWNIREEKQLDRFSTIEEAEKWKDLYPESLHFFN